MRSLTLVLLMSSFLILFAGCASTIHLTSHGHPRPDAGAKLVVDVTNPELSHELAILQASGIYGFTDREQGASRLTLHEIHHFGGCANPLMLTIITLGLVPGRLPGAYEFSYDLRTGGSSETLMHRLPLYERFSIWEHLIHQDSTQIFAEALRNSEATKATN